MGFSDADKRRYARHLILPSLGEAGQQKLMRAKVAVIGAGGLGSAALSYLAAAGVGTADAGGHITIIDHDHVEASNLARQIIHEDADTGRRKADSARDRMLELNPELTILAVNQKLDASNANRLLQGHNLVLDGCDNFPARFAIADASAQLRIPLVSAATIGLQGQISSFAPFLHKDAPCYHCLVTELPQDADTCRNSGVLGPLCGVIGAMQALEACRIIANIGAPLIGRLLRLDAQSMLWQESNLLRDPACPFHKA